VGGSIQEARAHIHRDPLPTVSADEDLIAQVFQNLLANALKFRGPRPCEIRISAARDGADWVVSVRDNGIGFDPLAAERIFDVFTRLHRGAYPGTGMGLTLCKRIVERHGGRIWAEATPGEGAAFSFSLPVADLDEPA
jgi:light-regulated signal transduction histidine kinase (bacteriophytochrome)